VEFSKAVNVPRQCAAFGKVSNFLGVIFSGSNIELLGSSELTHDAEVVARFSSAHFIL
jgi:hypothetical protein